MKDLKSCYNLNIIICYNDIGNKIDVIFGDGLISIIDNLNVKFFFRYVDDSFACIELSKVDEKINIL